MKKESEKIRIAKAKVRIAEAKLRIAKKALKESEAVSNLRTFFNFDDMINDDGELKQIGDTTEWLQELIDNNYLDNMWGVWFEDANGDAEAAGIEVKAMPAILAGDPEAQFGYSWGAPDTHFDVMSATSYVEEDGCDDWEGFGISRPEDDEYDYE